MRRRLLKHLRRPETWTVPSIWHGQTSFIVCGGPSVTQQQIDQLRHQRVILINTSHERAPWADYLLFTDHRWWRMHGENVRTNFRGTPVTLPPTSGEGFVMLERQRSSGISLDPTRLACWHTSVTSAINLAVLLGSSRIGLLGLDGQDGADGRQWHYDRPHPVQWGVNKSKYHFHAEALKALVPPLEAAGVGVFNLNLDSAHRMFPFAGLENMINVPYQLELTLA